ncbi:Bug family tripartite tricarboxylate transporter substrate binding protein [Caldovatus aquaticus]|uniref:Tripartite tricarboxylate transporter substrate binding protein n=1 Tax=Caldovatus aquaticus TaxID=2865671 RepID=A0ABS7EY44_9PROT|nr:tripartite tricarboxylate transporter substrate binding protein [Caldovatus aquaticus]MBW8268271.1 tripartite tricarboxylate transporter substrate binding protein [Caldovatus aquaticus]
MRPRRRALLTAGAASLTAAVPAGAQPSPTGERWPSRPVRIVAPYAPGGQSDTVIRLLQPRMAEFLGQPIVIENRTGAGGTIGAGIVAQAPPDGYTLLFESIAFLIAPLIVRGLAFDYETAFVPVGQAVAAPYVLAVRRDLAARDLAGFVAAARAAPGSVTYGTPGVGSPGHLAGALLESRADIRLQHVPYRGGAEAARDLAAGNIAAVLITANSIKPVIDNGRARGVALTSAERRGSLAHLPTIAESGYPGFDMTSWNGLFAPAGTPEPVIERLSAALRHATGDPAVRERLALTGNDAVSDTPAEFAARIRREREVVKRIVRESGIRAE